MIWTHSSASSFPALTPILLISLSRYPQSIYHPDFILFACLLPITVPQKEKPLVLLHHLFQVPVVLHSIEQARGKYVLGNRD